MARLASMQPIIYDPPRFFAVSRSVGTYFCMLCIRANLASAFIGYALCVVTAGCVRPWGPTFVEGVNARTHDSKPNTPTAVTTEIPQLGSEPSATDMAGVLDKLAQVRAMDPAAEDKLLAELRRTPPNSWPLVAEQFRASLAFHQQLAARPRKAATASAPMAAFDAHLTQTAMAASAAEPAGLNRPSTAIGALVDPHAVGKTENDFVAQSTPYSMPRPVGEESVTPTDTTAPAEFAASGSVFPIATAPASGVQAAALQVPESEIEQEKAATNPNTSWPAHSGKSAVLREVTPSENGHDDWQELVRTAADRLERQVKQSPTTTAEVHQHVSLRLLHLLSGDTEGALEPIPHLRPAEQDYWSRQIFAVATYLDHHSQPDDKRRAAASVVHLDEAVSHLRELGVLSLRNLSFCKNVYGYGAFEPYDADVFVPGEQVSLYVEVENYHSESSDKGFCTLLGATYEILNDQGKRISGGDFPDVDDCCRSRRRDFHIQFGLTLPQNLPAGRYRVELVVKDRQSDKRGHATVPFEIRGGRKLPP